MLSVVVPAYNEEESIENFYTEITKVLPQIEKNYELIFIDDGSQDSTLSHFKKIAEKDSHVRVFGFRKNRGKGEALTFGFAHARGDLVATLDADLQDKPGELTKLITKQKEGVDVVCGWRKHRKDKQKMVFISKLFNSLINKLFDIQLHDIDCGFKLFTKEAAQSLHLYGGLHRFIPVILSQQGFVVDEVVVGHEKRLAGKSKYGFSKVWKSLPDLFTMFFLVKYSKRPLHFFGFTGIISALIGSTFIFYLTILHYIFGQTVGRRPLLLIGILFVLAGFQILFTGFLADLIINIAHTPRMVDEEAVHYSLKYNSDKKDLLKS